MQYQINLTSGELYAQYAQKAFPGAADIPKRPSNTAIGGIIAVAIMIFIWVVSRFVFENFASLEDAAGPILFGGFAVALLRYAYLLQKESKRILFGTVTYHIQKNEEMRNWFAEKGWLEETRDE